MTEGDRREGQRATGGRLAGRVRRGTTPSPLAGEGRGEGRKGRLRRSVSYTCGVLPLQTKSEILRFAQNDNEDVQNDYEDIQNDRGRVRRPRETRPYISLSPCGRGAG